MAEAKVERIKRVKSEMRGNVATLPTDLICTSQSFE